MITWIGFAGKLIEFIAMKLLGKQLDLALDDKKRACRAFLDLHDALFDVEQVASKFLSMLQRIGVDKRPRLYSAWVRGFQEEVESCTARFVGAANQVSRVLEVLDPAVLLMFGQVHVSKMGMVAAASKVFSGGAAQFEVQWQSGEVRKLAGISYTSPPLSLMALDLEALYHSLGDMKLPRGMFEPGIDMLARSLPEENAPEVLAPNDLAGMAKLAMDLQQHIQVVRAARDRVRQFISAKFSVEDLLYVGSGKTA